MLLARQNYSFKVKALTYCNNLDLLSVGLSNGMIVNYTFDIQTKMEESKNSFYKKEPTTESKSKQINDVNLQGLKIQRSCLDETSYSTRVIFLQA